MALFLPLVAGSLMLAGAHASDFADRSMHQGFLSKYMGSDASKTSLDDYNKFVTPQSGVRVEPRSTKDFNPAKIVAQEEERAMQKVLANDNSLPIGMPAIGVSLLTLAAMLGVRMRRGQQQASSDGHESDMSIALAPAAVRGQVGWSQQPSKTSHPLTLCYATDDTPTATDAKPSAGFQFYEGLYEPDIPDVNLTRSKDGENGVATFNFNKPSFFNCEREEDVPEGAITAMRMIDEEGEISTANVSARFSEGVPIGLLVRHEMITPAEWDRFMRFMERYAEANGMGFAKA
jgi:photosystem II protein